MWLNIKEFFWPPLRTARKEAELAHSLKMIQESHEFQMKARQHYADQMIQSVIDTPAWWDSPEYKEKQKRIRDRRLGIR